MFGPDVNGSRWGDRIARARALAEETPPAAELLGFYAALAGYQQSLLERCGGDTSSPAGAASPEQRRRAFRNSFDPEWVVGAVRDPGDAADRFSETTVFVLEAVLQPLAERLGVGCALAICAVCGRSAL